MHIHVYADPGHAWGKVHKDQLTRIGLEFGDFSGYSYRRDDFIYLEEDGDLTHFAKVHFDKLGAPPTYREHHGNKSSRIRNYASNRPGPSYEKRLADWHAARDAKKATA